MKTFSIRAKRGDGHVISGKMKGRNREAIVQILQNKRLEPIYIEEKKAILKLGLGGISIAQKHLVVFARQMAFLVNAGVPVIQSLVIVKDLVASAPLKRVITKMVSDIEGGSSFAEALQLHPHIFSNLFVSLIRAGETGGTLHTMLSQLAEYIEKSAQIRGRVKKAMMYPGFVTLVGIAIIVGIMMYVVPQFSSFFAQADRELPGITQLLVDVSSFLSQNSLLIILSGISIPMGLYMFFSSEVGTKYRDILVMYLPIFGNLALKSSLARFTKTLSCLLSAGVNIREALTISSNVTNNYFVEQSVARIKSDVEKGKSIAESMRREKIFPSLVSEMMAIGEETGNIDATLSKVADFYEEQVANVAGAVSDLLQPFIIVFLGGMVGFIVLAIYLPIFQLSGVVSGV